VLAKRRQPNEAALPFKRRSRRVLARAKRESTRLKSQTTLHRVSWSCRGAARQHAREGAPMERRRDRPFLPACSGHSIKTETKDSARSRPAPRPGYHASQVFSEGPQQRQFTTSAVGGSADSLCSARVIPGLTHCRSGAPTSSQDSFFAQ